jgi:hypothetical protein
MKTRIYAWLLRKCLAHFIQQGTQQHYIGFPIVYDSLINVHQEVFSEDNYFTTKEYIQTCIDIAMQKRFDIL